MQTCSLKFFALKMSVLRMLLGISFLIFVFFLMGCGQGLSGQAIGEEAEDIEILKQEISDISDKLVELNANIENLASDQGIEYIRAVREEMQGNSDSLADQRETITNIEETIDVINSSVVDLASLVGNVDQAKASAVFSITVGDSGVKSGEIVEAAASNTENCNVSDEFQLSMKGFVFQSDAETFLKIDDDNRSTPRDIIGAVGEYERVGPFNDWHYGVISALGDNYLWTNRAGSSWTLYPDFTNDRFGTDTSNPYYNFPSNSPSRYFTILYDYPPCAD